MNGIVTTGLALFYSTVVAMSPAGMQPCVQKLVTTMQTQMATEVIQFKSRTIGFINNNPMNVKGKGWDGQTGTDRFGHAQFASVHYGLRAGARALVNMQRIRGCKTIRQFIHRYCEANREPYIRALSHAMGIGPDEEFVIYDHLATMMKTIVKQENGYNPYPDSYYISYTFIADLSVAK